MRTKWVVSGLVVVGVMQAIALLGPRLVTRLTFQQGRITPLPTLMLVDIQPISWSAARTPEVNGRTVTFQLQTPPHECGYMGSTDVDYTEDEIAVRLEAGKLWGITCDEETELRAFNLKLEEDPGARPIVDGYEP